MVFDRASKLDYDAWEALGNPGWGWDGLYKYFKRVGATNYRINPIPNVSPERVIWPTVQRKHSQIRLYMGCKRIRTRSWTHLGYLSTVPVAGHE